jgi:hypothetical protein
MAIMLKIHGTYKFQTSYSSSLVAESSLRPAE